MPHRPVEKMRPYERSLVEMNEAPKLAEEERTRAKRRRCGAVAAVVPIVGVLAAGAGR